MRLELRANLGAPGSQDHLLLNVKRQAISVAINTFTVYTFDLCGRLLTAFENGRTLRRSLSNRLLQKVTEGRPRPRAARRRWLSGEEGRRAIERIHGRVRRVVQLLRSGDFDVVSCEEAEPRAAVAETCRALEKVLQYGSTRLERDAQVFAEIYRPVGILPPDMYLSLVLQATEGCAYNRCAFCGFYRDQTFRVKSLPEFRDHIQKVKEFFGESIVLRKNIFLGEANALDLEQGKLLRFLDAVNESFRFAVPDDGRNHARPVFSGIYGFSTVFLGKQKMAADFAELRDRHLRRIYIGLESGSDALLRRLNKPADVAAAVEFVRCAKAGGVNVGIIILLGAGGKAYADVHVADTVEAVRAMNLGRGDLLYFSPLVPCSGQRRGADAHEGPTQMLNAGELEQQRRAMVDGLGLPSGAEAPKVATYDIGEFIY